MNREKEKTDYRVIRTQKRLRSSLLKLMSEKPVGKITPTALCREAGINRNTFYSHYKSVEDLLLSIEDEVYEQARRFLETLFDSESTHKLLEQCFLVAYKNKDICTLIFSEPGNSGLLQRIVELPHDKIIAKWKAAGIGKEDAEAEMLYTFYVNCSLGIIKKWALGGMKEDIHELTLLMERAIHSGLQGFAPRS